jgi:hypothetical protein
LSINSLTPTQRELFEAAPKHDRITLVAEYLEIDVVGAFQPLSVTSLAVQKLQINSLKGQFREVHASLILVAATA